MAILLVFLIFLFSIAGVELFHPQQQQQQQQNTSSNNIRNDPGEDIYRNVFNNIWSASLGLFILLTGTDMDLDVDMDTILIPQ